MLRTARRHFSFARILNVGSVLAVSAAAMPVVGADEPDRLEQRATVYLWAAGIDSTTASGDEVSVSFEQLIKNLNMTFMGAYELRKGPWSGGIDLVYLNVGAGGDGTVPVQGPGPLGIRRTFDVTADVKTRGWVIDL